MTKLTQLAAIILYFLVGMGGTMAEQNLSTEAALLVLEPEPLAPGDLLKTLDIESKQSTLGNEGDFTVVDGKVSVGRPLVYKLTNPKPGLLGKDSEKSHFYLVEFRFTLHPPENKRRYQEMKLEVKLSNPNATAFQLLPPRAVTEEDVNQSFDLGFSIASLESSGTSIGANVKQTVAFKRQFPIITAYGDGESDFYWVYSKPPSAEMVEPGSRMVAAVIQVPAEASSLSATIQLKVSLEHSFLGDWRNVPVNIAPLTVNLPLI